MLHQIISVYVHVGHIKNIHNPNKKDSYNPNKIVFSFSYYQIKKSNVEMLGRLVPHST